MIKAFTNEASDGQLHKNAELDDLINIDFAPLHPLTDPVFTEEAKVGGFDFLSDHFPIRFLSTFAY